MAGGLVALVALAGGLFVYRSLRGVDWAPIPGAARGSSTPRPASPPGSIESPAWPALLAPEDRALYERGRRLLATGDAKGALGPLAEAARRLPRDPVVVHDYGLALVRAGDEGLGLFQLEHASRLAPGIGSYRLDLVRALLAAGRRGVASHQLRELLARDPTNQLAAELLAGVTEDASTAPSPGASAGPVGLASAPSPRAGGDGAFTNEDLGRRRTAPPPSTTLSPTMVAPSASSPVPRALPSPPA